jgi:GWxTD domain-containing protein
MSFRPKKPGLIAAVLLALAAAAGAGSAVPELSKKERAERIRLLPEEERLWLEEIVSPIILPDEKNLFLLLTHSYQREMFKAEFWKRRELPGLVPPLGPGYQIRYLHLREIAAAEYEGISSDAGRMVIRKGEPASIDNLSNNRNSCSEVYRQAEIWTYPSSSGFSTPVNHIFYRPSFGAPRKLWLPGDRNIFQTASCLESFGQACARTASGSPPTVPNAFCPAFAVPRTCLEACRVARISEDISGRNASVEGSSILRAPEVSTEGLEGLWQRLASSFDPNAKPIGATDTGAPHPAIHNRAPLPARVESEDPQVAHSTLDAILTPDEIRERILRLQPRHRDWLELAGPLLVGNELSRFLQMSVSQKDDFIREFWRSHKR